MIRALIPAALIALYPATIWAAVIAEGYRIDRRNRPLHDAGGEDA